jgi:glycosyltransferase involved in cell wall biosynthesis
VRVAYLVTEYPRTSHSFIRREIQAVEALGIEVLRFSLRPLDAELVTAEDREELRRTRMVLSEGARGHAAAAVWVALRRPASLARALALAVRLGWRSNRGLIRHLVYLAEACVLLRWLLEARVDHLHAHFGTNSAAVAALCRALGGPTFSFTVHGQAELERLEALRIREKIRGAAFAVAVSDLGGRALRGQARPEDGAKVYVVRCGLDEDLLRAPQRPVPASPRLVCVGRLVPLKGQLLLVEAAARLAADGVPFELVLAGDGPARSAVEDLVRRTGLAGRVRLAGWLGAPQIREAILDARALVLPSFAEGLPVVLMEAFALRRPVVATTVGAIPELVEPGVSGWLVPAGDRDALTAAMRAVLEAPPQRLDAMGRAGAARVARDHDAAAEARELVALFRSAVAPGLASSPSPPRGASPEAPPAAAGRSGGVRPDAGA